MKKYPYFVVRCDEAGEVISAQGEENWDNARALAKSGIGTINFICQSNEIVDRLTAPPADIAEETIKFLQDVIKGRRHSSSPQCLPTAQYRRLVELAEQYGRAVENQKGE